MSLTYLKAVTVEQQNFKWTLRRGDGGGSNINVQLTLSGEELNMSTPPKRNVRMSNGQISESSSD